ncbi:MAG: Rab family GTPase [Candidatus Heimdallarchaeaceae archaeon]
MENIKLCIIGEAGTGKTQLLRTLCSEQKITQEEYGQNIAHKELEIENEKYSVTLWDLPAQQRFSHIRKPYYIGSNAVIVVFDLTRRSSFIELHRWVKEVAEALNYIPPIVFFGSKNDLEDYHEIKEEEIASIANKFDIDYYLLSLKSSKEIEEALCDIILKLKK